MDTLFDLATLPVAKEATYRVERFPTHYAVVRAMKAGPVIRARFAYTDRAGSETTAKLDAEARCAFLNTHPEA